MSCGYLFEDWNILFRAIFGGSIWSLINLVGLSALIWSVHGSVDWFFAHIPPSCFDLFFFFPFPFPFPFFFSFFVSRCLSGLAFGFSLSRLKGRSSGVWRLGRNSIGLAGFLV